MKSGFVGKGFKNQSLTNIIYTLGLKRPKQGVSNQYKYL